LGDIGETKEPVGLEQPPRVSSLVGLNKEHGAKSTPTIERKHPNNSGTAYK